MYKKYDNVNNDEVLAKFFEVLNSDKMVYVNFTYIAVQENHGQINFSTTPVMPKKEQETSPGKQSNNNLGDGGETPITSQEKDGRKRVRKNVAENGLNESED